MSLMKAQVPDANHWLKPDNQFLPDQRRFSDQDFFNSLDPRFKPLKRLQAALADGDELGARKILIGYFRARKTPRVTRFRTDDHWSDWGEMTVEKRADLFCENRMAVNETKIRDIANGSGGMDWKLAFKSNHLGIRQGGLATLAQAWDNTGNKKYAATVERWVRSYVDEVPFVLESTFHPEEFATFGGAGHPQLGSCYIIFHWSAVLESRLFRTAGVLSDDFWWFFLKNFYFLGFQFNRFLGSSWRADNHHLMERGVVPYYLGVQYPEFRGAAEMERYGRDITLQHFDHNILSDNVGSEHSSSYQYRCFIRYALPDSVGMINGRNLLGPKRRKMLQDWLEFQGYMTGPDGRHPDLGDGHGVILRQVVEQSGALYQSSVLKGMVQKLKIPVNINPDFKKSWDQTRVKFPSDLCRLYPRSGHMIMRNRWARDSHCFYLSVKNENLYDIHNHWDTLSFSLFSNGDRLIDDPLSRTYETHKERDEFRGHYFSMDAHNGLIINDDILSSYRALMVSWGRQPPRITSAAACLNGPEGVDFASFSHDGYRPLIHRRDVLQVRDRYYIVTDAITRNFTGYNTVFASEGDIRPHAYRQPLHFEANVKVRKGDVNGSLVAGVDGGGQVLIMPEPFENLSCNIKPQPYQDVLGPEFASCMVGEIYRNTMGVCMFSTVYHPFKEGEAPLLRVTSLTPRKSLYRDDRFHAILVEDGATTDLWLVQQDLGRRQKIKIEEAGQEIETDATGVFVSMMGGKVQTAFRIGGSFIKWNGRVIPSKTRKLDVIKILPRISVSK